MDKNLVDRRWRSVAALLCAGALVAAACGNDDGDTSAGQSSETTAEEAAEQTATTEAGEEVADEDLDLEARLVYMGGTHAGSNYDPHTAVNPFVNLFLYPAYDRLVWIDHVGELHPMLATSWEFSGDGLAMDMDLREGVVFHDGTPFDAAAVVANMNRALTHEASTLGADLAQVDSVEVTGDLSVRFNLNAPASALPALLSDRAGMMISAAAMDNDDLDRFPVGAGPFRVVDHQPGTVITFERFTDYWEEGTPKLAELELQMQLDEETRIRALLSGEVDATVMNSAVGHVEQAEEAGLGVAAEFGTGQWTIFLNKVRNPALGVLEVRQALMHAIDRQALVDGLFAGSCTPAHQPFPVEWWAGNPEVGPDYYPYDPDRARELLADAGYADGFTMDVVVANVRSYAVVLEAVQAQLAEVGVDMQIQVVEPAQLLATFVGGDVDGYYTIFPGGVDPAKVAALLLMPNASLNPGGYTPDAIVELAQQGLEASGEEERAPIYQEMSKVAADEAMHLVLCHPPFTEGFQPDVTNLYPNISIHATDFRYVGKLAE